MPTQKEAEKKGLINGKDYINFGGVLYQAGDKFLKGSISGGKEIEIGAIADETHFSDHTGYLWHTGMFDDYRCRHCPALNDPSLAPEPGWTPFEILQENVEAARKAFKAAERQKTALEVYEDCRKICFIEDAAYFLDGECFDEDHCAFLNKEGVHLLESMWRYFIDHPEMKLNSSSEAYDFVNGYVDYYGGTYESMM